MLTKIREQINYKYMILLVIIIVNFWTVFCLFNVMKLIFVIDYGSYWRDF